MHVQVCRCPDCGGLVKPNIVFFGEGLPKRFFSLAEQDFETCELLIVMGTSLAVQPFNGLINRVGPACPRLLINRELVGERTEAAHARGSDMGLWFGTGCVRDAKHLGDCDDAVHAMAKGLGWSEDLAALVVSTTVSKVPAASV